MIISGNKRTDIYFPIEMMLGWPKLRFLSSLLLSRKDKDRMSPTEAFESASTQKFSMKLQNKRRLKM